MKINFQLKEVTRKATDELTLKSIQAGAAGLYQAGEYIMAQSKERVPVDTGNLRASGFVEMPEVNGSKITVKLGYGGLASPYALMVHENPRAGKTGGVSPSGRKYKTWAKVGEWKYLEKPMMEAQAQNIVLRFIQQAAKDRGIA